jgi:hypothetical protein
MVRGARLAIWAVPVLAILSPVPARAQAPPRAEHFSVLVLPISAPSPGLRPLAAVVQDAVQRGLRQYGAAGQVALAFRRDDPAVQRALREHPYIELPPDEQVSPALADALAWVLDMDAAVSGSLEADDAGARLTLRASSVRSRPTSALPSRPMSPPGGPGRWSSPPLERWQPISLRWPPPCPPTPKSTSGKESAALPRGSTRRRSSSTTWPRPPGPRTPCSTWPWLAAIEPWVISTRPCSRRAGRCGFSPAW